MKQKKMKTKGKEYIKKDDLICFLNSNKNILMNYVTKNRRDKTVQFNLMAAKAIEYICDFIVRNPESEYLYVKNDIEKQLKIKEENKKEAMQLSNMSEMINDKLKSCLLNYFKEYLIEFDIIGELMKIKKEKNE